MGYLAEGARTNLLTYSQQFDNAAWSKFQCSVTADATTSPDGTATADKLITDNGVNGNLYQATTLTAVSYTASVFAKAGEWSWLLLGATTAANTGVWFDLSSGAVGTQNPGYTGSIQSFGDGWYRCSVTFTGTAVPWDVIVFSTNADNSISNGDGTSGIYIWGAQIEAGAFPSSYIPTTTASVTRNADVLTYPSSGNAADAGTIYAEYTPLVINAGAFRQNLCLSDGTANNRICLAQISQTGGSDTLVVVSGGVTQASPANAAIVAGTTYKKAAYYDTNAFRAARGGTLSAEDTSGAVPTFDKIEIGHNASSQQASATIKNVRVYQSVFTDAQLQIITA
jgi:hypothetical protein